jgi:formate/nitrite transporter
MLTSAAPSAKQNTARHRHASHLFEGTASHKKIKRTMLHLREEIANHSIIRPRGPVNNSYYCDEEAPLPRRPSSSRDVEEDASHTTSAGAHDCASTSTGHSDSDADAAAAERVARQLQFEEEARACQPVTSTKSPSQTLAAVYSAGQYKAGLRLDVLSLQSFMAGIYIAAAGQLFLSLGSGILGAAFFATGLLGVVLTSGELFTGDALIFVAALLGGRVQIRNVVRNWTVSWTLNFAGCLAWAFVIGYASNALQDVGGEEFAIAVAEKKASQTFLSTFLKGIAANFLVCVGVWQATCAEEVAGKVLALFFPITAFVASGFDHCIANQFFFPVGMLLGANVSIGNMFFKLLAATLGNVLGGGFFVGAVYWYCFEEMSHSQQLKRKIRVGASARKRASLLRSSLHWRK